MLYVRVKSKEWQCQDRLRMPSADLISLEDRDTLWHCTGEQSDANTSVGKGGAEVPSTTTLWKMQSHNIQRESI